MLAAILTFALTACGRTRQPQPAQGVIERPQQTKTTAAQPEEPEASEPATAGKILIAYFTVPETDGVDAVSGASGFSGTIRTIRSLEPDATVIESGLSVSRNSVPDAAAAVKSWTDSLLAD